MKKILTIIGARPQFIKHAPLQKELKNHFNEIVVHTGQHYDNNMSEIFFKEMEIDKPKYNLNVGSSTHAEQTGKIMILFEEILMNEKPDCVIIYGDTNSTLAGALTTAKLKMRLAHIEAGMRSFNMNMPEEINRIISDRLSDYNFAPSFTAMENLENEGMEGIFTGDIMYDAFLKYSKIAKKQERLIEYDYILMTIHRESNTLEENLKRIIDNILKTQLKFVFPIHPRTRKIINKLYEIKDNKLGNIEFLQPQGYIELLNLLINSNGVLTDSGGLQKETFFAKKKCITVRNETEWVETLQNNANILCPFAECNIESIFQDSNIKFKNYYGNGNTSEIINNFLMERL